VVMRRIANSFAVEGESITSHVLANDLDVDHGIGVLRSRGMEYGAVVLIV
jgi:hypothetical protein